MEVWVTNRNGSTTETRDIVGLMDLGEPNPFQVPYPGGTNSRPMGRRQPGKWPFTSSCDRRPGKQEFFICDGQIESLGLRAVQDFEKTFARKLNPTDYYFNPQVGFCH